MSDQKGAAGPREGKISAGRLRLALVAAAIASPIMGGLVLAQNSGQIGEWAKGIAVQAEKQTEANKVSAEAVLAATTAQMKAYRTDDAATIAAGNASAVRRGLGFAGRLDGSLGEAAQDAGHEGPEQPGAIYVAVSLTMPPEALRRIVRDANKAGVQVVIRGFVNNSMKDTAEAVRRSMDQDLAGGIAIDPQVFRAYGVQRVPTFIVAREPVTPCDGVDCVSATSRHDRVSGNISLQTALRMVAEDGKDAPDIAAAALARLEG